MGYEDIRTAFGRGFSVGTLNEITRLGHGLLASDTTLQHPSAAYALAATAQKIALLLDGLGVQDESVSLIEAHIKPKMEAVLNAADGNAELLVQTLDDLARAYSEAGALLK